MEIRNTNDINNKINTQDVRYINSKKAQRNVVNKDVENRGRSDEINISEEGKTALEIQRYSQIAKRLPSVRPEEINRVKQRIQNGFYANEQISSEVADRLLGL